MRFIPEQHGFNAHKRSCWCCNERNIHCWRQSKLSLSSPDRGPVSVTIRLLHSQAVCSQLDRSTWRLFMGNPQVFWTRCPYLSFCFQENSQHGSLLVTHCLFLSVFEARVTWASTRPSVFGPQEMLCNGPLIDMPPPKCAMYMHVPAPTPDRFATHYECRTCRLLSTKDLAFVSKLFKFRLWQW